MMWSARACLASSLRDLRFPFDVLCQPKAREAGDRSVRRGALTSHIGNAEDSDGARLDDTALVGQERRCARWETARTVLEVARVIVWSGLDMVSSGSLVYRRNPGYRLPVEGKT